MGTGWKDLTDHSHVSLAHTLYGSTESCQSRSDDEDVMGRFPQVSGLCFTYDIASPAGSRVTGAVFQAADGCTGAPVDLTAGFMYTLAENDFMASGGDGYPFFTPRVTTQGIMDHVLADFIAANTPLTPAIQGRVVCTDSNRATAPNCPVVIP